MLDGADFVYYDSLKIELILDHFSIRVLWSSEYTTDCPGGQ